MFTLKISTANAAFDNEAAEVARILRDTAKDVEQRASSVGRTDNKLVGSLRDHNGNVVGKWELK